MARRYFALAKEVAKSRFRAAAANPLGVAAACAWVVAFECSPCAYHQIEAVKLTTSASGIADRLPVAG